jgi:hypothetical protein
MSYACRPYPWPHRRALRLGSAGAGCSRSPGHRGPGRDRYARAALTEEARPGSRNGYRGAVKTTAGPVELAQAEAAGITEASALRLFGAHVTEQVQPRMRTLQ